MCKVINLFSPMTGNKNYSHSKLLSNVLLDLFQTPYKHLLYYLFYQLRIACITIFKEKWEKCTDIKLKFHNLKFLYQSLWLRTWPCIRLMNQKDVERKQNHDPWVVQMSYINEVLVSFSTICVVDVKYYVSNILCRRKSFKAERIQILFIVRIVI